MANLFFKWNNAQKQQTKNLQVQPVKTEEERREAYKKANKSRKMEKAQVSSDLKILSELAEDKDIEVRFTLASRIPLIPPLICDKLAEDKDVRIRKAIAEHIYASTTALDKLSQDKDIDIRRAVANNFRTAQPTLARLALEKDPDIKMAVAKHNHTSPETLARLASEQDPNIKMAVAQHEHVSPETLTGLVQEQGSDMQTVNMDILQAILFNPNTSSETLNNPIFTAIITSIKNSDVRCSAIQIEKIPPAILDALVHDSSCKVRYTVANHPSTLPETLDKLAKDQASTVRWYVARNQHTPTETLRQLANDQELRVREAATKQLIKREAKTNDIEEFKKVSLKDRTKTAIERSNAAKTNTEAPAKTTVSKEDGNPGGDDNR